MYAKQVMKLSFHCYLGLQSLILAFGKTIDRFVCFCQDFGQICGEDRVTKSAAAASSRYHSLVNTVKVKINCSSSIKISCSGQHHQGKKSAAAAAASRYHALVNTIIVKHKLQQQHYHGNMLVDTIRVKNQLQQQQH